MVTDLAYCIGAGLTANIVKDVRKAVREVMDGFQAVQEMLT